MKPKAGLQWYAYS